MKNNLPNVFIFPRFIEAMNKRTHESEVYCK